MDIEASSQTRGGGGEQAPGGDLPGVTGVEIKRITFEPPMRFYRNGELISETEAIELMVRTTGPLPGMDMTPVMFIGDEMVDEYEGAGPNRYRFVAYGIPRLRPGAVIALGWRHAPQKKIPSRFRFQLGDVPIA